MIQAQIQALLVAIDGREATERPNSETNMKVAKPPIFSREARNIAEFIMLLFVCLVCVLLYTLFLFDITFFPSRLISLYKIGLYISLCYTVLISVLYYED